MIKKLLGFIILFSIYEAIVLNAISVRDNASSQNVACTNGSHEISQRHFNKLREKLHPKVRYKSRFDGIYRDAAKEASDTTGDPKSVRVRQKETELKFKCTRFLPRRASLIGSTA